MIWEIIQAFTPRNTVIVYIVTTVFLICYLRANSFIYLTANVVDQNVSESVIIWLKFWQTQSDPLFETQSIMMQSNRSAYCRSSSSSSMQWRIRRSAEVHIALWKCRITHYDVLCWLVCVTWHFAASTICAHSLLIFTGRQHSLLCKPCTSRRRDVCLSVRPSVRPFVTQWHWVKTTQARITKSSPADSVRTLVFG